MTALLNSLGLFSDAKPDAIALSMPGQAPLTWRELEQQSNQLAHALLDCGVRRGERICLLGENSLAYALAFFASLKTGACVVPLPTLISADALRLMIDEVEPAAMFVSAARWAAWQSIAPGLTRTPPTVVLLDESPTSLAPLTVRAMLDARATNRPKIAIPEDALFNIIYSSGTTGTPKGIVHAHAFRSAEARYVTAMSGLSADSRMLIATPLYSNSTIALFATALTVGAEFIVLPKFDAQGLLEACARMQPTHVAMVPVQIERVLDLPAFDALCPKHPIVKISGAAKLSVERKRELLRRWPGNLIECYGMSEGGPATALDAGRDIMHLDSVGKPLLDSDIRIIDEHDTELARGATGEIVGCCAAMMTGYYRQPELTRQQQWHDRDGHTYLRTGDVGRFDEAGFLHVVDRKKDVIISGGFNIYASDLEEVLKTHADVADAAVIGVSSREWGETPIGFVLLRPQRVASADVIREWANQRLGKLQRLAAVVVRQELPRGGLGKVLKRRLREEFEATRRQDGK